MAASVQMNCIATLWPRYGGDFSKSASHLQPKLGDDRQALSCPTSGVYLTARFIIEVPLSSVQHAKASW